MNPLTVLVKERVQALNQRGVSIRQAAKNAGWVSPATINSHLYRQGPLAQMIQDDVIDGLAEALDVPRQRVWKAAVLATLPEHPTPLQRLLREAQARNGKRVEQLAEEAGVNRGTLDRILRGLGVPGTQETVEGIAAAFGVSVRAVERAAAQHPTYEIPLHIQARMTPEKWADALRILEAMVSGDDV